MHSFLAEEKIQAIFSNPKGVDESTLTHYKNLLFEKAKNSSIFAETTGNSLSTDANKFKEYFSLALDTHQIHFHSTVAFLGGIASQEILKAVTRKFKPIS